MPDENGDDNSLTPLAEFMAFAGNWSTGVDGISKLDLKIPPEQKYNAFPVTDQNGQMYRFVVYAPFGSRDPNAEARKAAIERVVSGLPIRGQMGDGSGAPRAEGDYNTNTAKQGNAEHDDVTKGLGATSAQRKS